MKAVYLVIDYVPHQVLSIKTLIGMSGAQVLAFHVGRFHKEVPDLGERFLTIQYNSLPKEAILEEIRNFRPDIIVTAGWMIPEYNSICKAIKKESKVPIVAMSDTPWYGTYRQKINSLISPFHLKKAFTHLWVAGSRQYDYARKLGFSNQQIIFNSLSADVDIFKRVSIEKKKIDYPKNFLYIGRFDEVKGLRNLIKAWNAIENKNGWTFTLVGKGNLKTELQLNGEFLVKDYMSQERLLIEMQNSGCFVLASIKEPWAIVLHEAAAAGLPIVCTETCGASPHLVVNNYNGFTVENNSVPALKHNLAKIINSGTNKLIAFSHNSKKISYSINPELHVASLIQLLDKPDFEL